MPYLSISSLRSPFRGFDRFLRSKPLNGDGSGTAAGERPLRAELFSVSQLEQHAKSLAGWHEIDVGRGSRSPDRLLPRLKDNERVLREAYAVVTDAGVVQARVVCPSLTGNRSSTENTSGPSYSVSKVSAQKGHAREGAGDMSATLRDPGQAVPRVLAP